MGIPKNGRFIMENPKIKWMMARGTPHCWKPLYLFIYIYIYTHNIYAVYNGLLWYPHLSVSSKRPLRTPRLQASDQVEPSFRRGQQLGFASETEGQRRLRSAALAAFHHRKRWVLPQNMVICWHVFPWERRTYENMGDFTTQKWNMPNLSGPGRESGGMASSSKGCLPNGDFSCDLPNETVIWAQRFWIKKNGMITIKPGGSIISTWFLG